MRPSKFRLPESTAAATSSPRVSELAALAAHLDRHRLGEVAERLRGGRRGRDRLSALGEPALDLLPVEPVDLLLQELGERLPPGAAPGAERHAVLRASRAGQARLHRAEIELEPVAEGGIRRLGGPEGPPGASIAASASMPPPRQPATPSPLIMVVCESVPRTVSG